MRILTRYLVAGFLIILSLAPVFASADETASSPTSTAREDMPPQTNETPVEFNKDYLKGYVTDFRNIVTSPARWDASDWLTATLVTGVAVSNPRTIISVTPPQPAASAHPKKPA